jgi:hypothetical protein
MSLLRELGFLIHRITGARKVPDLLPHPEGATTLALRGFTQLDAYSCGAVAGWCVVWSFDRRRSFERFFRICETSPDGTGVAPLIRALEAHGISVKHQRHKLPFETLCRWIDQGLPVICIIDEDRRDDTAHWMVVYGYARKPDVVYAFSGALRVIHPSAHS